MMVKKIKLFLQYLRKNYINEITHKLFVFYCVRDNASLSSSLRSE
jgi:hypothetical protein